MFMDQSFWSVLSCFVIVARNGVVARQLEWITGDSATIIIVMGVFEIDGVE